MLTTIISSPSGHHYHEPTQVLHSIKSVPQAPGTSITTLHVFMKKS